MQRHTQSLMRTAIFHTHCDFTDLTAPKLCNRRDVGRMERRLLDIETVRGVLLVRDRLELSAAFLIPHLLQQALAADLKVTHSIRTSF